MKGAFGMIGMVLALVVVGLLVRSQLAPRPLPTLPATGAPTTTAPTATVAPASATARAQAQRLPQDVRQSVEGLMQQPRPVPEDPP